MTKAPALSPLNYNTFLGFRDDVMFVLKQLSLGHDIPKIETLFLVKTFRDEPKKSAREIFADICVKLDLSHLSSEKKMRSTAAKWYGEFAVIRSQNVQQVQGLTREKPRGKPARSGNNQPAIPEDIIGYYRLDLDVLAECVDALPPGLQATLRCLRTGSETGAQIGAKMDINLTSVSNNFSDIYRRMRIQHIKARKHKRIIARLAYLRSAEKKKMVGKPGAPTSPDST